MCDPAHLIAMAVLAVLRGEQPPPALLLEEPGVYRVHLLREGASVTCRVEYAQEEFAGARATLEFEGAFGLRRLARDVAKGILDCAAAGAPISDDALRAAKQILGMLRGDAASPWKQAGK